MLKAPKRVSTVLPAPLEVDLNQVFGVKVFGRAWFKYIEDPSITESVLNMIEEHILRMQGHEGLWTERAEAIERIVRLKDLIVG